MTENSLIQQAAEFATQAHAGQTRRGSDTPYFTHVEAVARRVQELADQGQADPAMVAAAYLHDTMEDCGTTHAELAQHFGTDVADLVAELTNDDEKKHRMGKETYMVEKLSHLTPRALTVKLCDTLSNISDSPTPEQAAIYIAIQQQLRMDCPAVWNKTHSQLSNAILDAYFERFAAPIAALQQACISGDTEQAENSIKAGAYAGLKFCLVQKNGYRQHETYGTLCAAHGHTGVLDILLRHGAEIDACNQEGRTPLLCAAEEGHLGCIQWLLEHGADLRAQDDEWRNGLSIAAENGHVDCVRFFLERGFEIDEGCLEAGITPLGYAVYEGHLPCVKYLVEQGADIHCISSGFQESLLTLAVTNWQTDVVQYLISIGAPIDIKDYDGMTPLIRAADYAKDRSQRNIIRHLPQIVELLLQGGSNPNLTDKTRYTALVYAKSALYWAKRSDNTSADELRALQQTVDLLTAVTSA